MPYGPHDAAISKCHNWWTSSFPASSVGLKRDKDNCLPAGPPCGHQRGEHMWPGQVHCWNPQALLPCQALVILCQHMCQFHQSPVHWQKDPGRHELPLLSRALCPVASCTNGHIRRPHCGSGNSSCCMYSLKQQEQSCLGWHKGLQLPKPINLGTYQFGNNQNLSIVCIKHGHSIDACLIYFGTMSMSQ